MRQSKSDSGVQVGGVFQIFAVGRSQAGRVLFLRGNGLDVDGEFSTIDLNNEQQVTETL
jgi:hypothetical protein